MSITVTLPIKQEDVVPKMKEINDEMQRLKEEKKQLFALMDAVQGACSHPKIYSDGGSYGGPSFSNTYCEVCGKCLDCGHVSRYL